MRDIYMINICPLQVKQTVYAAFFFLCRQQFLTFMLDITPECKSVTWIPQAWDIITHGGSSGEMKGRGI